MTEIPKALKDVVERLEKAAARPLPQFDEVDEAQAELTAAREALVRRVEKILAGLYEGVELEEGVEVQYVGVYILKWGKVAEPSIGFRLVEPDALMATEPEEA